MVTVDDFVREREPQWRELDLLLVEAGTRPERLGAERVRRLGALYRSAAADLAAARRRFPGESAVSRLEQLVLRARHVVYDTDVRRDSLRTFFGRTYWRRVRERPRLLAVAALLLLGPLAMGAVWGVRDSGAAGRFVPEEYASVTEPRQTVDLGLSRGESSAVSAEIFTNNIRVSLFTFAGGITLGIVTGYLLVFNGLFIGAILGLAIGAGNSEPLLRLITPHGVLELSCIIVAGMTGFRIGAAVIAPGNRKRSVVLQREARAAVELVLGTLPWLVLAGIVEGFVTPQGLALPSAAAVGIGLGVVYWGLVIARGAPAPSTADTR